MKNILKIVLSVLILTVPAVAKAQEEGTYSGANEAELNKFVSEDDGIIKDGYEIPTFKNLSKLYWALAMFDLNDKEALDHYLFINECELYQKYYSSDFEFESLREATKESIMQNMRKFPTKFEIMIPIGLDRYDTGTEKFKLDPRSFFSNSKRMEINVNDANNIVCGKVRTDIAGYPKNFILTLSRPFSMIDFPASPDLAQAYIEESQKRADKAPVRYKVSKFGRVAYVRLKVTMNQFKGYVKMTGYPPMADIFGSIDGYQIFGDREKTMPLYDFTSASDNAVRKRKEPTNKGPAIPQAGQQLIGGTDATTAPAPTPAPPAAQ